jgi:hypothetical protein
MAQRVDSGRGLRTPGGTQPTDAAETSDRGRPCGHCGNRPGRTADNGNVHHRRPCPVSGQNGAWTVGPSTREAPWTAAVLPQDREEGVEDLLDTLKQCVERIDRYRRLGQRVGESNTRPG